LNKLNESEINKLGIPTLGLYWVQRRTHKKRRINKKWLKRYGYRIDEYLCGKLVARDVKIEKRGTSSEKYGVKNFKIDLRTMI